MIDAARILCLAVAVAVPGAASAQSFKDIVHQDLGRWEPGLVLAVHQVGQKQILKTFGHRAAHPDSALSPNALFPFPALTDVLVGVVAQALVAAHYLNEDAPISHYLPGLTPELGRATLHELLTNTAGIDDAARGPGESWEDALDHLDDSALVAAPGALYSESRYSLPLAVRVIESVVGKPFDQIATAAVLQPLGMDSSTFSLRTARSEGLVRGVERTYKKKRPTRIVSPADTVDGLPVLFTTTDDVVKFLSAWMSGGVRGGGPADLAGAAIPDWPGARYGSGIVVSEHRGLQLVSLARTSSGFGTSANFYLLPESRTAIFVWSVGEWPFATASWILGNVMDVLRAPPATAVAAGPADTTGYIRLEPETWAGTYRNGKRIFALRDSLGTLVLFDGARDLKLTAEGPTNVWAHPPHSNEWLSFNLHAERDGRRYLYYRERAFAKESAERRPLSPNERTATDFVTATVYHGVAPRLLNPEEVQHVLELDYPPALRKRGIGGTVDVWFSVDRYGMVKKFKLHKSSDEPELDVAALEVAGVCRFAPDHTRDRAVPVWVAIPITFSAGPGV